ncbi:peptide-methionine (S)-S-oxide reductase MsrA [Sphingosinicella sp. CPCC 101087]|uniref:peptide-methionine (S)-S-oxide reductase MsrA n=1 Tax=Sphingosinicella sp. CPCC 101087 TaxID=2497754 RepID=UPI00101DC1C1|nr:peptide-methionine (S)-S-oxide reductase MsrA [Sphingosinicella sp. CPCC 101087]
MRRLLALLLLLVAGVAAAAVVATQGADRTGSPRSARTATAVFAGGCFWCTESDFDHVPGVTGTLSGYIGGRVPNPTYQQVSAGNTGHIEAVRVVYDPAQVSYATLVERFFRTIDPLDGGGQFCDRGDQYRSAIFVANAAERRIAEAVKARVARQLGKAIETEILPRGIFYRAEAYHQDYYRRNPVRYRFYRWNCGRDARLQEVWSGAR